MKSSDKSRNVIQRASRLAAEPMYRVTAAMLAYQSGENWSAEYSGGSWSLVTSENVSERERGKTEAYLSLIPAVYYMIPFFWVSVWFFQLPTQDSMVIPGGLMLAGLGVLVWLSLEQLNSIELEVVQNV